MCWKSSKKPERLIADKDIPVFKIGKVVGRQVMPYFCPGYGVATYKEEKTYGELEKINPIEEDVFSNKYTISRGLHSYSVNNIRLQDASYTDIMVFAISVKIPCVQITTLRMTQRCNDVIVDGQLYGINKAVILLCYIPKGTAYYVNEIGEMVSERLQVIKIIKTPFTTNKDGSTSTRSVDRVNKILDNWEKGKNKEII